MDLPILKTPLVTQVDDADSLLLAGYRLHLQRKNGRPASVRAYRAGKTVMVHRLLLGARPGVVVDHINRDPLDNRRQNLRCCAPGENNLNRRANTKNKSGFKGVYREAKATLTPRWRAEITLRGKKSCLGTFSTPEAAAAAYDAASALVHKEFGATNQALRA